MKSLIASTLCIALASLWFPSNLAAQDRAVDLQYQGADGVWLPLEMSRQLQADAEESSELQLQIRLMTDQLQLAHDRHENVAQALALSMEAERRVVASLERAVRLQREAEEDRDAWFRAPAFWAAVGGAVILTIQVVAVWAFNQLADDTGR